MTTMSKQVIFTVLDGNSEQGFTTILRIQDNTSQEIYRIAGNLPSLSDIGEIFRKWQECFHRKVKRPEGISRGKPLGITKYSDDSDLMNFADRLSKKINCWLNAQDNEDWRNIRDKIQRNLNTNEEIRFIIQTDSLILRQLPWQTWDLLADYPKAEIALSPVNAGIIYPVTEKPEGIRILAVLGKSDEIDIDFDVQVLNNLCSRKALVETLVKPSKHDLLNYLRDKNGWDIFFFAGHSETLNGKTGLIHINTTESLEISEFKNALGDAIEKRLKLAIFNSCDGLGLARQLEELQLPYSIVMREPIPDSAAKAFLKDFLTEFSEGSSFYASVHQARRNLEDSFNKEYPGIAWLPIICQNLPGKQPTWNELGKPVQTPASTQTENKGGLKKLAVAGFFVISGFICILVFQYNIPVAWKAKYFFGQAYEILRQDKNNQWTEPLTDMEFVRIAKGCYEMGCNSTGNNCADCETPLHTVCLDEFWIGKYEVTQEQWKIIMGNNPAYRKCDNCPAEGISWNDIRKFAEKLKKKTKHNYRLPTEAEWEYVCKSGFQAYGMDNKTGEWCEDAFIENAYQKHQAVNPVMNSMSVKNRVVRGINLQGLKDDVCTFRLGRPDEKRTDDAGFRLVLIRTGH
ncbi:MAG: SUMF1/EgtB/PvdO family nonheme iron enzyme [Desulfobacteraceae bacterium]|nr:SUMF1/EgtB/PvdO family nonheme iron enzyme [Desulfobacteraceae bacterium]